MAEFDYKQRPFSSKVTDYDLATGRKKPNPELTKAVTFHVAPEFIQHPPTTGEVKVLPCGICGVHGEHYHFFPEVAA